MQGAKVSILQKQYSRTCFRSRPKPVLKGCPVGHKNVVFQDRWSCWHVSVAFKGRTFCQEYVVLQDRWCLKAGFTVNVMPTKISIISVALCHYTSVSRNDIGWYLGWRVGRIGGGEFKFMTIANNTHSSSPVTLYIPPFGQWRDSDLPTRVGV